MINYNLKFKFLLLAILFTSFFLASPVYGADYYVSPSGNDSNSGAITAPFRTIQHAADVVNPGDTVIVKDGTYTKPAGQGEVINITRSGTSSNWITFKAENKWGAKLDGQMAAFDAGIYIYGASYVRFEDFEVKGGGHGVSIYSSSHDIYLYRLYIHDVGQVACTASSASDYEAHKLDIYFPHFNAHSGIFMDTTTFNVTSDSILMHNIGKLPCSFYVFSDYCKDHGYYAAGNNHSIINNIFYSIEAGWPVQITGGNGWIVSNNVAYGTNPYENGRYLLINQAGAITNAKIQNNICYNSLSSCVDLWLYGTASGIQIKNNLVYKSAGGASLIYQPYGDSSQWTESNNILNQDPKLVNAANKDFHLQAGSPAINAGLVYLGRNSDADDNPIVGNPDIGAYEYASDIPVDATPPASPTGLTVL